MNVIIYTRVKGIILFHSFFYPDSLLILFKALKMGVIFGVKIDDGLSWRLMDSVGREVWIYVIGKHGGGVGGAVVLSELNRLILNIGIGCCGR